MAGKQFQRTGFRDVEAQRVYYAHLLLGDRVSAPTQPTSQGGSPLGSRRSPG